MKRAGDLIDSIADLNNLYLAFWKAQRHKEHKEEVKNYRKNLELNLNLLQSQILSQQIKIGDYNYFTIYDPKERVICAASFPERVLHHTLMNICHPYFEKFQIYDSYATRINKGTYAALERAKIFHFSNQYYLKLDVRKYFDSIDHEILKKQLAGKFKDTALLDIFSSIIDSYHTNPNTGLPIGNLTSQYFANFYLNGLDHYIKEDLHVKSYVRYMDDMVLWTNNYGELEIYLEKIIKYVSEILNLTFKIQIMNTTNHGLTFLSYRLFSRHVELASKSKKRFIKKTKEYEHNLNTDLWTQKEYQRHVLPLIAFTDHASAKGFRKKVFENIG